MREMCYRQRNIVFPETVMNSARYWGNLTSRKYPFTATQKIGFLFIFIMTATPALAFLASEFRDLIVHPENLLWILDVGSVALCLIYLLLISRAFFAVFGNQIFPEMTPSSRRNLVTRRDK